MIRGRCKGCGKYTDVEILDHDGTKTLCVECLPHKKDIFEDEDED
jgi:hypothetical protein